MSSAAEILKDYRDRIETINSSLTRVQTEIEQLDRLLEVAKSDKEVDRLYGLLGKARIVRSYLLDDKQNLKKLMFGLAYTDPQYLNSPEQHNESQISSQTSTTNIEHK